MNSIGFYDKDASGQRAEQFLQVLQWIHDRLGRHEPPVIDTMDSLRSRPPGSLGHAWAQHLDDNGLKPFDYGPRRQQLHDGVHVLTGYGTDPLGEAEVQAFLLGAKFYPANLVVLLGLLRGVNRQRRQRQLCLSREEVRSRLVKAFYRGKSSHFDPDTWQPESWLDSPLAEVQAQFGIVLDCKHSDISRLSKYSTPACQRDR